MTTVEYDLDLSGGLMEEIQRLTAPPQSEESLRRQRAKEREFRRPRAVNHDSCDSCKEGGDLLCCDRCPAAFHLLCHDPPLEEEEVPTGEWLCHTCKMKPPEEDDRASTCSSHSRHSVSSQMSKKTTASSNMTTNNNGGAVPLPPQKDDMEEFMEIVGEESKVTGEKLTPLTMLARAAKFLNPKQFDLPKDVNCPILLPGASKKKVVTRGPQKKLPHELDNGMVPLPAKLCFICSRSCRASPLIQCDYCPLLYHMDCCTPPLTTLPTGRWMCANHPESFLEEKFLKSAKVTERVKLWNKFSGPVNQQSIKVQFLKRVHRKNPPFRLKVRHPRKHTIDVPHAIKAQYAKPMETLPKPEPAPFFDVSNAASGGRLATPEEQEEWLTSVVSLQTGIARHLTQRQLSSQRGSEESSAVASSISASTGKPTASVTPVVKQECPDSPRQSDSTKTPAAAKGRLLNGVLTDTAEGSECESYTNGPSIGNAASKPNGPVSLLNHIPNTDDDAESMKSDRIEEPMEEDSNQLCPSKSMSSKNSFVAFGGRSSASGNTPAGKLISASVSNSCNTKCSSSASTHPTSILSPVSGVKSAKVTVVSASGSTSGSKVITVSSSAGGKTSPTSQMKSVTPASLSSSPAINQLNANLQAHFEGNNGDLELSKLDEKLVQVLALQRLQQLLPQKTASSSSSQPKKSLTGGSSSPHSVNEVRARALLCPLTGKGQPVTMPYRCLYVGTGVDMDVCLSNFGHCNFISAKHACIFYDETSRQYELLNYSEHGTTVDNVLYSCDFSEKASTTLPPTSVVASVRKIIGKGKAKKEKEIKPDPEQTTVEEKDFMSAHASESYKPCSCKASSSSLIGGSGAGWEGTALLHHGSYIKLGCLQFVFSIVESAPKDPSLDKKQVTSLLKQQLKSPTLATVP